MKQTQYVSVDNIIIILIIIINANSMWWGNNYFHGGLDRHKLYNLNFKKLPAPFLISGKNTSF